MSMPYLSYIMIGQYVLGYKLNLFPVFGYEPGLAALPYLVLPVSIGVISGLGSEVRLYRTMILDEVTADYVRTARAKGLSESVIMVKHVLKGALLPVVSYLGPAFAHIVTGSIVVETIFRVPGLGRHFVQSALNRDYTLIMGTVIVYSVILLVMNFIVDILYGFMDPRISYR